MTDSNPTQVEDEETLFDFDNTFVRELEGCYRTARPARARAPRLVAFNAPLAEELGLDPQAFEGERGARIFTGQELPAGAEPIAQVYAGHQFGHFTPQLGDGRALLLGEVVDRHGRRRDVQLKGSGPTHFSRGGDGLSALGPVLREYVVSEAMHALGVPTTRALAAATTGEMVHRDEGPLPGGVFTRVASSHLRVGTFEFFASRGQLDELRRLVDYAVARHDPHLVGEEREDRVLGLLEGVRDRQAALVAQWMSLGFVHGVMNTDNTAISGETIDYGPCAFMERYDEATVFSSIDRNGRYAYGHQAPIALWNLVRCAEAILPAVEGERQGAVERARGVLAGFQPAYEAERARRFRAKLGLATEDPDDGALAEAFLGLLHRGEVDFTNGFRALAPAAEGNREPLLGQFADRAAVEAWLERWDRRAAAKPRSATDRAAALRAVNPAVIPRNERVEEALEAAVQRDDYFPFKRLLAAVTHPYDEPADGKDLITPAPANSPPYRTFCGT